MVSVSQAGATALHYAAGAGDTSITIHALIFLKVPLRFLPSPWQEEHHCTVGCVCRFRARLYSETILALVDCGADLNSYNETVPPPIHMAVAAMNAIHANCLLQQAEQRQVDLNPSLNYRLPGNVTIWHICWRISTW